MDQEQRELKELREDGHQHQNAIHTRAKGRIAGFFSQITLEPVLGGALLALFLTQTSQINLYMRTACLVDLHYSEEVCNQGVGEQARQTEIAIQEHVARIKAPRGLIFAVVCTTVLMFLGPWSDCSGRRKPLLIMSLLGMCLSSINALALLTFPGLSAGWIMYLIQMPVALGGAFNMLVAAGFCYVSDVCKQTGRDPTIAYGSVRAAIQLANVVGWIAGPLIYRQFGFYGVYATALFVQVCALVFVLCRVRDVHVNTENRVSVLDVRLPVAAVRCLLAKRPQHRRSIVLMMVLVAMMDRAMFEADDLISFLYFRNKFVWDDLLYGIFSAYKYAIMFVGTILTLKLLKNRYQMSDEMIGVLSGASLAASKLALIVSNTTLLVFLVPIVGLVSSGSLTVQRPIVNKHIDPSEQGKIHSVTGALEQAFQAAVIPLFPLLYAQTVDTAPDAWLGVFVFKASLQVVLFTVAIHLTKRQRRAGTGEPNDSNFKKDVINCEDGDLKEEQPLKASRSKSVEDKEEIKLENKEEEAEVISNDCSNSKSQVSENSTVHKDIIGNEMNDGIKLSLSVNNLIIKSENVENIRNNKDEACPEEDLLVKKCHA